MWKNLIYEQSFEVSLTARRDINMTSLFTYFLPGLQKNKTEFLYINFPIFNFSGDLGLNRFNTKILAIRSFRY